MQGWARGRGGGAGRFGGRAARGSPFHQSRFPEHLQQSQCATAKELPHESNLREQRPSNGKQVTGGGREPTVAQVGSQRVTSVEDFYFLLQKKGCGSGPEPQSWEGLRAAMLDLVAAYEEPWVQEKVHNSWIRCGKARKQGISASGSEGDTIHCLQLLLQPLQMGVAKDHGFAPTPEGLQRMQNAVQRRICEGDKELRVLANRAMALLGLPTVPCLTFEFPAEDILVQVLGETAGESGMDVRDLFQALEDAGVDVREPTAVLTHLLQARMPVGGLSLGLLATWAAWERYGLSPHLSRLPEALSDVVRLHRPSPDELLRHVMQNRPVVIAGALEESGFPPLRDFADFGYLRSRCGHRDIKMKGDPTWDGSGRQLFINDPCVGVPLADYLGMIEEAEQQGNCAPFYMGKVPLSEEVPELVEDVEAAPASPWRLYRSAFGESKGGLHTYFGCGRNTTSIHADPSENLLVVISGSKTFDLYPPCDADCLYPTVKRPLNSPVPPFARPDAMPVGIKERYPLYKHAHPMRAELSAGDILYLPFFWWHGVAGCPSRNMILNWWFKPHPSKAFIVPEGDEDRGPQSIRRFLQGLQSAAA